MLAERDLLRHLLGSYLQGDTPPRPTPDGVNARRAVRDAMTRQVLCVSPEQPLAEVASSPDAAQSLDGGAVGARSLASTRPTSTGRFAFLNDPRDTRSGSRTGTTGRSGRVAQLPASTSQESRLREFPKWSEARQDATPLAPRGGARGGGGGGTREGYSERRKFSRSCFARSSRRLNRLITSLASEGPNRELPSLCAPGSPRRGRSCGRRGGRRSAAEAPQRRGRELVAPGQALEDVVGEPGSHGVQCQVGEQVRVRWTARPPWTSRGPERRRVARAQPTLVNCWRPGRSRRRRPACRVTAWAAPRSAGNGEVVDGADLADPLDHVVGSVRELAARYCSRSCWKPWLVMPISTL